MAVPDRYDAFWIPGTSSGLDSDVAIGLGMEWLTASSYAGPGVIVVNAKGALSSHPIIAGSGRQVLSPQSERLRGGPAGAVLALFPTLRTLEMAQRLALDAGLCVIPGSHEDVEAWIVRTGARNLADPDAPSLELAPLDDEVRTTVEFIVSFVGHKSIGGDEKVVAVRQLQAMIVAGHRPATDALIAYAMAQGQLSAKALRQLRETYEALLAGKTLRDYSGRAIR